MRTFRSVCCGLLAAVSYIAIVFVLYHLDDMSLHKLTGRLLHQMASIATFVVDLAILFCVPALLWKLFFKDHSWSDSFSMPFLLLICLASCAVVISEAYSMMSRFVPPQALAAGSFVLCIVAAFVIAFRVLNRKYELKSQES